VDNRPLNLILLFDVSRLSAFSLSVVINQYSPDASKTRRRGIAAPNHAGGLGASKSEISVMHSFIAEGSNLERLKFIF
jgi:hypothetical protein